MAFAATPALADDFGFDEEDFGGTDDSDDGMEGDVEED